MTNDGARLDAAIIGGGIAGTSVARDLQRARPSWSVALFERTDRIGGRLRSVRVDGLDHPIELGGMRYITSHCRMAALVDEFALQTHPFDADGAPERSVIRGVVGGGADDPEAGAAYDLDPHFRGRSATDLLGDAFERIVPGFAGLDHDGFAARRASATYLDRRLTDWPIGEVLETVLGAEGRRFVTDAFGYDPGMRPFNAPDLIEFLSAGGDPTDEARVPDEGMDSIPRGLADRFQTAGGSVAFERELESIAADDGALELRFADDSRARAARVVLALPLPALQRVAASSPSLQQPVFERIFDSVEGFPAMKLYLWYERPWWRPSVPGIRSTTDLPLRKIFYFDGADGSRSTLLAMYSDGMDVRPWADLYDGAPAGAPASPAMLAEVTRLLSEAQPDLVDVPPPIGSALMYWGADPREVAWHFWSAGDVSDEILRVSPQPDEALPVYIANEAFSRHQSWAEGALEAAESVIERLIGGHSKVRR